MEGRVALITGGASGIGRAFVEALLKHGAKVCFADLNVIGGQTTEVDLQSRYGNDRVFFHMCDVSSEEDLEATFQETIRRFGHVDILCNNAGVANENNWKLMLDINLAGVLRGTMIAFKYMGKAVGRDDAVIINTASDSGVLPCQFLPMYAATKHGVVGFSRSIGESSPRLHSVRVNCLCPTITKTAIRKDARASAYGSKDVEADGKELQRQMGGVMEPADVANGLVELLSKKDLSAATMLVSPKGRKILEFPSSIDQHLGLET